jgi:putative heme-binding domain-containing protein
VNGWVILLILSGGITILPAQEADLRNPSTSPSDVAAGARIFRSHCAECHGLKGEGGRGPSLTMGQFRHGSSDGALLRTIMKGIPGTEMPGVYFEEHQVWQIVAFVRSLSARPVPRSLHGSPANGEKLFRGKGGCAGCHMVNGTGGRQGPDLSDIGARRSPEHLRTSLLEPNKEVLPAYWSLRLVLRDGSARSGFRLNEDTYSIQMLALDGSLHSFLKTDLRDTQISKTSLMPSYGKKLSGAEVDDLIAYLASLRRKVRDE